MTKIDETKQYKFSEIVRMVEDKELPVGTLVNNDARTLEVSASWLFMGFTDKDSPYVETIIGSYDINTMWTIKLPKEGEYYLKAPHTFAKCNTWLNLNTQTHAYFLGDTNEQFSGYQTQFTQSEISAMPFDTSFFGEPIKVEVD